MKNLPTYQEWLNEGISNIDKYFLEYCLDIFDKKMLSKNPFGSFLINYVTNNGENIDVKIKFNKKLTPGQSYVQVNKRPIFIELGIKDEISIKRIRGSFAHELTHISQDKNGFVKFEREREDLEYGTNTHALYRTEHEAVLVTLLIYLKDSLYDKESYDLALSMLYGRASQYFQFTFKDFMKKAYVFGVDSSVLKNLKSDFIEYANNRKVTGRDYLEDTTLRMLNIDPKNIEDV